MATRHEAAGTVEVAEAGPGGTAGAPPGGKALDGGAPDKALPDEALPDEVVPDEIVHEFGTLLGAAALLDRIAARELERRCGIRHAVFEVLLRLSQASADRPPTMGALAGELILTSGGMTRLVDRMERDGYVRRRAAPGDRRCQVVELTDHGRRTLAGALRVHAETLDRHFAGPLGEEPRRHLVGALATLREHARRELGSLG